MNKKGVNTMNLYKEIKQNLALKTMGQAMFYTLFPLGLFLAAASAYSENPKGAILIMLNSVIMLFALLLLKAEAGHKIAMAAIFSIPVLVLIHNLLQMFSLYPQTVAVALVCIGFGVVTALTLSGKMSLKLGILLMAMSPFYAILAII